MQAFLQPWLRAGDYVTVSLRWLSSGACLTIVIA